MTTRYNSAVHKFALFCVAWTVLLLAAGAIVTSKDAALSVPDYPTTHGTYFPSMSQLGGGALFEHSHRVIAACLGIFLVGLAIVLWRKDERRWVCWLGAAAVGGVIVQGLLGGLTVLLLLRYGMPVMHAAVAQIMLGTLVTIAIVTSRWWTLDLPALEDARKPSIHSLALLNAAAIFVQMLLGAAYRHQEIHTIAPHVAGSLLVTGTVIWLAAVMRKRFESSGEISRVRAWLHAIFGTQFMLGLAAYWARVSTADAPQPMPVMVLFTVLHTVVGALLFAVAVIAALLCHRLVPRGRAVAAEVPAKTQREATAS